MKLVIDIPEEYYEAIMKIPVYQSTADMLIIKNGTPLESYLSNERCDTCKYVDCSIDNEPCIDCKVPHKSFYEPRQEMSGGDENV